jgi:hypothetical protein
VRTNWILKRSVPLLLLASLLFSSVGVAATNPKVNLKVNPKVNLKVNPKVNPKVNLKINATTVAFSEGSESSPAPVILKGLWEYGSYILQGTGDNFVKLAAMASYYWGEYQKGNQNKGNAETQESLARIAAYFMVKCNATTSNKQQCKKNQDAFKNNMPKIKAESETLFKNKTCRQIVSDKTLSNVYPLIVAIDACIQLEAKFSEEISQLLQTCNGSIACLNTNKKSLPQVIKKLGFSPIEFLTVCHALSSTGSNHKQSCQAVQHVLFPQRTNTSPPPERTKPTASATTTVPKSEDPQETIRQAEQMATKLAQSLAASAAGIGKCQDKQKTVETNEEVLAITQQIEQQCQCRYNISAHLNGETGSKGEGSLKKLIQQLRKNPTDKKLQKQLEDKMNEIKDCLKKLGIN